MPKLRWIVQYNNKVDICGGLYPVNLDDLEKNHFTWIFEPFHTQRLKGKTAGDADLVTSTIEQVCERLFDMMSNRAGRLPITVRPDILYQSPHDFVIVDEKGDPNSRLVLAAQGYRNLISLVSRRDNGRFTYSVIRGCPYDEDTFQIDKLIAAFQAAEDEPNVWGGSNLAAGSDSLHGSRLTWQELRDIAEPIVREAAMKAATLAAGPLVLVAMAPENRACLLASLESAGARSVCVDSCAEALRVLDSDRTIGAIFASPTLRDGHCEELLATLRRKAATTPVVVCSQDMDGGWVDLLEAGAFRIIRQHCDVPQIRAILDALLEPQPVPVA
jgi:CheY-like chemotaxis protein